MILMNDFRGEPTNLLQEEMAAADSVLRSGWFILGEALATFETEWAHYCGTKFAVGVGNGMDAIEIALRALDIGPGDEVITTPMTAAATVMAILRAGATPVLADIDPGTGLLDLNTVVDCLTSKTKAVLLVHLYGQLGDMTRWQSFCEAHGIHLLEDCAQSHGASINGVRAGAFGVCGAYSFYPTKNLGARGDGGAIVTNSETIAMKARALRNYGQDKRYFHPIVGLNSRLDELQAAILSVRLRWLDRFNQRRQAIAEVYWRTLKNAKVQLMSRPTVSSAHVSHLFVLRCQERDALADHLKANGIESLSHYPKAIHHQPFAEGKIRVPLPLPCTEQHAATCLSLPCHPQLKDEEVVGVVSAVNSFVGMCGK